MDNVPHPEGENNGPVSARTPVANSVDQKHSSLDVEDAKIYEDDDKIRTGTVWTAAAHIITAVIGSGVLALSWSIAQMGWVAGPIILLLFAWCTWYTSKLLTDCYRYPHPVTGKRNYIYMDAVKANLSSRQYYICGLVQYSNLVGTSIGYTIATATSARNIQKTNCRHSAGSQDAPCLASTTVYIIIYGVIQIFLSQIPNFGEIWWLSYVAAVMSFLYSFIILGLGIDKSITKSSNDYGSVSGVGHVQQSEAQQVWNILIALGNMAFAYSFSMILIEIQDTLRSPPPENKVMKRATRLGISTTTFFYVTVGITGYLAFGNSDIQGNVLVGFSSPYWLVDFANTCVVIHLVGAYQVYTQPVFQIVEAFVAQRYTKSPILAKEYKVKLLPGVVFPLNLFRTTWRTVYVVITTVIAICLPFFNDILGIIGALGFWPLTVYFPVAMYIAQHKIPKMGKLWIGLQILSFVTFLVSLGALIGSVEGVIYDVERQEWFKAT